MREEQERIDKLIRGIGEIDDRYLNEAVAFRPVRRQNIRYSAIAAILMVAFCLAVVRPMLRSFSDLSNSKSEVALSGAYGSLDELLLEATTYVTDFSSVGQLSKTGAPRLVWQDRESGEISVCHLTESELARVERNLGKGRSVGEQSPDLAYDVWIVDKDGWVVTPYLKASAGNAGCEIFDYDPEIIPDDALIKCILDILS